MTSKATDGTDEPHYASISFMQIESVLNNHMRFRTRREAIARLDLLRTRYIVSRENSVKAQEDELVIWVKGFNVTDNEKKSGFKGNFAKITIYADADWFCLLMGKIERELKFHPQRSYHTHSMPFWGHPVLRNVLKKRPYATSGDAERDLLQLRNEYGGKLVTQATNTKFYAQIYCSQEKQAKKRVKSYVLNIESTKAGFLITAILNTPRKRREKISDTFLSSAEFASWFL